jgi:uncharacterized protein (DUF2062 family)
MREFIQTRVIRPIQRLLLQGITPQKIALTIALGIVLGVFPVMGSTSLLCAGAAIALRLNLPAIQAVNYVMYPLQLLLIVPFIRSGEFILRAQRTTLTLKQMVALLHDGFLPAMHTLWILALQGIVAWLLIAPAAIALLYFASLSITRRAARMAAARQSQQVSL